MSRALGLVVLMSAAIPAIAQFSYYGSPNDPSGNPLPVLTWSGPPVIGTTVTITQPVGAGAYTGYLSICSPLSWQAASHQLIVGVQPTSAVITPSAAPMLCLPQFLIVDLSAPYLFVPLSPMLYYNWMSLDPLWFNGFSASITIPNDPALIGFAFYAQATTVQYGPGGCSTCVLQLSRGIQALGQS